MNNDDLISIVIPVYNVELYLDKCISSIVSQTYKNIEIILVNDGSTDNSLEISKKWEKQDNRIVLISKKNGGLSSARNCGIDNAHGKFIMFLDSDDFIIPETVEIMHNDLVSNNADLSICNRYYYYEDGSKKLRFPDTKSIDVMNKEDALKRLITFSGFDMSAWAKLYKIELFDKIRFPEGKLSEDYFIMYLIFSKCSVVVYNSKPVLYYVQRKGSITKSIKPILDYIDAAENQMNFIGLNYDSLSMYAKSAYCLSYFTVYNKVIVNGGKIDSKFENRMKSISKQLSKYIYTNDMLSFFIKAQVFIFNNLNFMYNFLLKMYKKNKI